MLRFLKKRTPAAELRSLLRSYELPHFPGTVTTLLSLLRDPTSPTAKIVEQVEADPSMNVRVLRLVNSAANAPARLDLDSWTK